MRDEIAPLCKQKAVLFPCLFHFSLVHLRAAHGSTRMGANQYTQRPLVTLCWRAGVQNHRECVIYPKQYFRRCSHTRCDLPVRVYSILALPLSCTSPAFLKTNIMMTKASAETRRSALTCLLVTKNLSPVALSTLLSGNDSFASCIVQRRNMRRSRSALPFPRRIDDGCVCARESSRSTCTPVWNDIQQICCAIPALPSLPFQIAVYGREMRARSVEHLSELPTRAHRPSRITMTAARIPQCDLFYQNLDHRLWSATASHPPPILSLNPLRVNGERDLRRTGGVFHRERARACRLLIVNQC